jgi:tryptophan-rich sensory protein
VFGPAWTVLYALMAFALWRVLSAHPALPGRGRAIALFYVQLGLNGLWSWSFFAAHSPAAGLANILALDLAAVVTVIMVSRIDRLAAWCLAPYLAWIAFATYLNAGVLVLN